MGVWVGGCLYGYMGVWVYGWLVAWVDAKWNLRCPIGAVWVRAVYERWNLRGPNEAYGVSW